MRIGILMSPGCGNGAKTLALAGEVVRGIAPGIEVGTVMVETLEDAERLGFLGSSSIRVNGQDIDPQAPANVGLGWRLCGQGIQTWWRTR